jgi:hypothetical protein
MGMDWIFFLQVISAVIIANLLSFGWLYFAWRVTRQERETGTHEGLPTWVYLLGAAAPLVAAGGAYFMPH